MHWEQITAARLQKVTHSSIISRYPVIAFHSSRVSVSPPTLGDLCQTASFKVHLQHIYSNVKWHYGEARCITNTAYLRGKNSVYVWDPNSIQLSHGANWGKHHKGTAFKGAMISGADRQHPRRPRSLLRPVRFWQRNEENKGRFSQTGWEAHIHAPSIFKEESSWWLELHRGVVMSICIQEQHQRGVLFRT